MAGDDVQAILVRLAAFEARVTTQLEGITTDNTRGEGVHQDHEARLRQLEAVRWKAAGIAGLGGFLGGGGLMAAFTRLIGG